MSLEWFLCAVIIAVGSTAFGHFERGTSLPKRLARWFGFLLITGLLSFVGRPWTFVWILGLPGIGTTFHLWWCLSHGINPLTAEPKEKYFQLRGWAEEKK
ncbi:MAG TPA: hypothetical protein VGL94_18880 [Ktedonobacteraceae bacterium]|jgi:hypothetical protein